MEPTISQSTSEPTFKYRLGAGIESMQLLTVAAGVKYTKGNNSADLEASTGIWSWGAKLNLEKKFPLNEKVGIYTNVNAEGVISRQSSCSSVTETFCVETEAGPSKYITNCETQFKQNLYHAGVGGGVKLNLGDKQKQSLKFGSEFGFIGSSSNKSNSSSELKIDIGRQEDATSGFIIQGYHETYGITYPLANVALTNVENTLRTYTVDKEKGTITGTPPRVAVESKTVPYIGVTAGYDTNFGKHVSVFADGAARFVKGGVIPEVNTGIRYTF